MDINACYKIGYVAKTHGLKGEVTIILNDALPIQQNKSLLIQIGHVLVPYFIESISDRGDRAFVKFEEVNGPDEAKQLKGCSLYLPRKVRPKPGPGEFYNDEVVGFEVEDATLGFLGKITEVSEAGPNRLLAIDHLGKEILIPVNGPFIQSLNRARKKFRVDLPAGFLDI